MMRAAELSTVVADWSYGDGLSRAVELMERHRPLRPRRLANAQLAGLNAVVQMASSLGEISEFVSRQGTRAGRAGRLDVKAFWDDLRLALEVIADVAKRLGSEGTPGLGGADRLALLLAGEFTQHLISHAYLIEAK